MKPPYNTNNTTSTAMAKTTTKPSLQPSKTSSINYSKIKKTTTVSKNASKSTAKYSTFITPNSQPQKKSKLNLVIPNKKELVVYSEPKILPKLKTI